MGMVIDISHACNNVKMQFIEASRVPVVTSHNGLRHFKRYKEWLNRHDSIKYEFINERATRRLRVEVTVKVSS